MDSLEAHSVNNGHSSGQVAGTPSAKDWHDFSIKLGWFPVTATKKANRTFEMSDGSTVTVTPQMMRDITTAIDRAGKATS